MITPLPLGASITFLRDVGLLAECWLELARAAAEVRLRPSLVVARNGPASNVGRSLQSRRPTEICRWIERAASIHFKRMTCLERALAAKRVLRRRGFNAELHIGVRRADQSYEAHAWLTLDGRSLDPAADDFVAMRPVSMARRPDDQDG